MKYDLTGWLTLDGKATFVKCCYYRDSKTLVRVCVPRRFELVVKTKKELQNTKASCLRRQIKLLRQEFAKQKEAFIELYTRLEKTNSAICNLRDQLKSATK